MDAAIQATLFHHGIHGTPDKLRSADGRAFLQRLALLPDARERITIALAKIDALEAQLAALERELRQLARRQTGCRALMRLYGMGELTSLVTLCELGDVGRLSASRKACACPASTSACTAPTAAPEPASSPAKAPRSCAGRSTRPPSPPAARASPDHADYLALKARGLSHTRASLTIARKLARRSYHVLHALGPAALEPIATT